MRISIPPLRTLKPKVDYDAFFDSGTFLNLSDGSKRFVQTGHTYLCWKDGQSAVLKAEGWQTQSNGEKLVILALKSGSSARFGIGRVTDEFDAMDEIEDAV